MMFDSFKKKHGGFSLLEVLIAIIIFAIGLLGVAALQIKAQQAELEAFQRAQAVLLLQDMVDRINNNRKSKACYYQSGALVGVGQAPGTAGCDTLADTDLAEWDARLEGAGETLSGNNVGGMIGARGCITVDPANSEILTVTVAWQGLTETVAPTNTCAQGLYTTDTQRRLVSNTIQFADLD